VCTENNIYGYDRKKNSWKKYSLPDTSTDNNYSTFISCIVSDSFGGVWVGAQSIGGVTGGIYKYNEKSDKYVKVIDSIDFSLSRGGDSIKSTNLSVTAIYSDGPYLWIASRGDLIKMTLSDNKLIPVLDIATLGLEYDSIIAISKIKEKIVIATTGGLVLYDVSTGVTRIYKKGDISSGSIISALACDDVNIYYSTVDVEHVEVEGNMMGRSITTWKGMDVLNLNTETWAHCSVKNGLPSNEIRSIAVDNSFLYIATDGGVFRLSKLYLGKAIK
jgi:ligand-binding sensor domain-containing protein